MKSRAMGQAGVVGQSVVQLLDEHHLVVLADEPEVRMSFVDLIRSAVREAPETQVIDLGAAPLASLDAFGELYRAQLDVDATPPVHEPKRRVVLWPEADRTLEVDVDCFAGIVDRLLADAQEQEFDSPDLLVVNRFVLFGGPQLGAWAEQAIERRDAAAVDAPGGAPLLIYRIDG
jgi:hypothetical protein